MAVDTIAHTFSRDRVAASHSVGDPHKALRVFLVDQMTLVREGLQVLLSAQGLEVVGGTATVEEAVGLSPAARPDVILLDQDLIGDASSTISALNTAMPEARIAIVVNDVDDHGVDRTATTVNVPRIPRQCSVSKMVVALRAISKDARLPAGFLDSRFSSRLERSGLKRKKGRPRSSPLTGRQLEILTAISQGDGDRMTAVRLKIAEGTVKSHIRHILEALGVRNRTQAVAYGLRKGLIT